MQAVGVWKCESYHAIPIPSPHGACTISTTMTKTTPAADTILAFDLGKYKTVSLLHSTLSHALSIAASGSGSASR
jgi:hypothetical protein